MLFLRFVPPPSVLFLNRQTIQVKDGVAGGKSLLLLRLIFAEYYAIMSLPNCWVLD